MRRTTDTLLCLAFAICLAPAAAKAQEPNFGWVDQEVLTAGGIEMMTASEGPLGLVTAQVALLIRAPAEAIWDVLTACEIAPDYVPNVISCSLLETLDGGRAQIFVQTIRAIFFLPRFEHVFRLDYEPYRRIEISRLSGPVEELRGYWELIPQPDGVMLVRHHLELDPGTPIPRFLVRARLRRDLPRVLEAVRERSEAVH